MAHLEVELKVNAAVVVYCPDPAIARRYRRMLKREGLSLPLRPFIFTPQEVPLVVDVEVARASPALAVFSAICHGGDPEVDEIFPALAEALQVVGPSKAILYYDIVLAGLPQAPRTRWEAFMTTAVGSRYCSELFNEIDAQGEARGEKPGRC